MLDKIIRTVVVYWGLIVLLRLAGKRDLAQLNSFDLIVVLLLSNVVQNAIIGPDNSLVGGLIGATVLIAANAFLVRRRPPVARCSGSAGGDDHRAGALGRWIPEALRREGVRQSDMEAALRRQNAYKVATSIRSSWSRAARSSSTSAPSSCRRPRPTSSGSRPSWTGCSAPDPSGRPPHVLLEGHRQADDWVVTVRGSSRGCTPRRRGGGRRPAPPGVRRRRSGSGPLR